MSLVSIGDLSQSLQLRRDNARLTADLNRLASELASGQVSDVNARVRGDFSVLSGIERGLARTESFDTLISEAGLEATARQSTIESMRVFSQDIAGALIMVDGEYDPVLVDTAARDGARRFDSALNLLNTQVAGRSLFAGMDVAGAAIADSDTILTALEADIALAGATTAADVEAVIDAWFAPGGGFETVGYVGSVAPQASLRLSDSEVMAPPPTASDLRIREALAALAGTALLDRGALAGANEERATLARSAGERLLSSDKQLVDLQAEMGLSEGQIERAQAENRAETDALELARTELLSIDVYEAAAEIEVVEAQLQTLYTITAKLSRLSLTEYL